MGLFNPTRSVILLFLVPLHSFPSCGCRLTDNQESIIFNCYGSLKASESRCGESGDGQQLSSRPGWLWLQNNFPISGSIFTAPLVLVPQNCFWTGNVDFDSKLLWFRLKVASSFVDKLKDCYLEWQTVMQRQQWLTNSAGFRCVFGTKNRWRCCWWNNSFPSLCLCLLVFLFAVHSW